MADLRNLRPPPPWNIEQNSYENYDCEGFVLFSSISSKDTTGAQERIRLACKNGDIKL